jgi:hypothetical protein
MHGPLPPELQAVAAEHDPELAIRWAGRAVLALAGMVAGYAGGILAALASGVISLC